MGDLKLFRIKQSSATELESRWSAVEKSLQTIFEKNLEEFLGIRILASEHSTGVEHGGRIDSLGLDEDSCPVIIEYKRATKENVINQGLFYLDWLMDHKAEFKLLVQAQYGQDVADEITWSSPRLVCIAGDFTKFDSHAVKQIDRNIDLIRYRWFDNDLLLLELVNAVSAIAPIKPKKGSGNEKKVMFDKVAKLPEDLKAVYDSITAFLLSQGDDVQMRPMVKYIAFRRMMNFASLVVRPSEKKILVFSRLDPETVQLENGFTRDIRKLSRKSKLEITIRNLKDFDKAKQLLVRAYENS